MLIGLIEDMFVLRFYKFLLDLVFYLFVIYEFLDKIYEVNLGIWLFFVYIYVSGNVVLFFWYVSIRYIFRDNKKK